MNVYLDYAATSPLTAQALSAMLPYLTETYGNPDSLHAGGRAAAYAVTRARDAVASVFGVSPAEVYFTSGGTEADNWAVRRLSCGKGICVSAVEHHAVLGACKLAEGEGMSVTTLPVEETGMVSVSRAKTLLNADMGLLCVMAVNNETGVLQPLGELAEAAHARGMLVFSDCVQAACTQDLKETAALCDALAVSAHKVGGPKGVGALIVKKGVRLSPLLAGGEQERGMRAGTLNVAGVVGFAEALTQAQAQRARFKAHTGALRARFEETVCAALGDEVRIDGRECRAENISHLTFYGAGSKTMLARLDLAGVCASGGAACAAHSGLPSHVLLAMGRSEREAERGVRFSFGMQTTEEEVHFAADAVISAARGA